MCNRIGASAQAILLSGPGAENPRLRARPSKGRSLPYFEDLEKLNRYEVSIQRQLKRSLDTLRSLIRERLSAGGPSSSGSVPRQKPDGADGEIAAIRREVLGHLLAEFGPNPTGAAPESVVLSRERPNKSNISAVVESVPAEQTQLPVSGPDAVASARRHTPAEQTRSPANGPDPSASALRPVHAEQTQLPAERPDAGTLAPRRGSPHPPLRNYLKS